MSNSEAKFILSAYRPNGRDAATPAFIDALKQAERDPELGAWFVRSRAHDSAIAAKIESIRPPAGLREAILAGAKVSRKPAARPFWQHPGLVAAAAVVAIALGLTMTSRQYKAKAADSEMAQFALDDMVHGKHGGHGAETGALSHWLSTAATPLSASMPVNFDVLKSTGCRTLSVAGHDVMEVCFERSGAEFHLYVARLGDVHSSEHGPDYVSDAEGSAASWADSRYAYTLVTAASVNTLKRLL